MPYDPEPIRKRMSQQLGYQLQPPPKPAPPRNHHKELRIMLVPKLIEILQEIAPKLTITTNVLMKHEALLTLTNEYGNLTILCHITGCELQFFLGDDKVHKFSITDRNCFDAITALLEKHA